ncbi:MAG: glycosyltransferase [Pseudomonadota bacterium]|nr:glycosyltransferase [Pseudomonadota bacterium]
MALALRLRASGFEPVIAAAEYYRSKVEAEGLGFAPMRPDFEDIERDLGIDATEGIRRMIEGNSFILEKVLFPSLAAAYEDVMRATADADLILTSNLAFGARLAAEKRGLPHLEAAFQPALFLSAYDPPELGPYPWLARLPRRLGPLGANALFGLVRGVAASWAEPVHRFRRELGLPSTRDNPIFDANPASLGTLALYSSLMGDVQPDFPARTALVGFTFYDSESGGRPQLPAELEAFLAAGSPPLVFSLGSTAVLRGEAFYRDSLAAARRLGERAVILVGSDQVERWKGRTGPEVFVGGYAPHSLLFPRARAIAHHGGMGTTAQAIRAGRPQLVVPFMADQPDNAARLVRLGVARTIPHLSYSAKRAASELRALVSQPTYEAAAARAAAVVAGEDGAGEAVRIIEETLRRRAAQVV